MKDYKIIFLRKSNGHAIGCVAISLDKLNVPSWELKDAAYQVSMLSPYDNFDRSVARQIALGRLLEKPFFTQGIATKTIHTIIEGVMRHISNNPSLPRSAKRAAKLWLETKLKRN